MKKNTDKKRGFVLGAGAAIAGFLGYHLFGPKGKEHRDNAKDWMMSAKEEVMEKLDELGDASEEKYHDVVDTVMAKYKKLKTTTKKETDSLEVELKKRFNSVKNDLTETKDKVAKKVTKK